MSNKKYDDEKELNRYVLGYYTGLLTRIESLGLAAASAKSEKMIDMLRQKWGAQNNPEVVEALSQGIERFRTTVRNRILTEHADEVFINRCPECKKLVATPRAQLCLWCGHIWKDV
ncbi:hypothetical protein [Marinicella meishanensis]|uniref:hypothetical protein n=1 Tax=Marinicella meishanensis TaxID=2873263 RepID=UPI001CBD5564|nr:hypothetical protein [Marinicella sp. NBU2979]